MKPKSTKDIEIKRSTKLACLSCEHLMTAGKQYPAQPVSNALELWCRACGTISVFNYLGKIQLITEQV